MNTLKRILISTTLLALPLSALADDDHRGRGHGHQKHYQKHHHKHHSRHDDRHGHRHHDRHHDHHVSHERVYVPAIVHGPVVHQPQGVTIHGNVHVPF